MLHLLSSTAQYSRAMCEWLYFRKAPLDRGLKNLGPLSPLLLPAPAKTQRHRQVKHTLHPGTGWWIGQLPTQCRSPTISWPPDASHHPIWIYTYSMDRQAVDPSVHIQMDGQPPNPVSFGRHFGRRWRGHYGGYSLCWLGKCPKWTTRHAWLRTSRR